MSAARAALAPGLELSVGIGDLKAGQPPVRSIVTHALGSCIGAFAWDPQTLRGACLHFVLPKADDRMVEPARYADTGLPKLIRAVADDKAAAGRLRIVACGGANLNADNQTFRIGSRNIAALRQFMWKYGLVLAAHDLGGESPRTARLDLQSGKVTVSSGDRSILL
ncbi:MAG: chemotaxis protein CheD [Myxococcota bacterium]